MTYHLEQAEDFNARVPVGTPVRYWPERGSGRYFDTVTQSAAWECGDGSPIVKIEGFVCGVHIDHVRVLPARVSDRLREALARICIETEDRCAAAIADCALGEETKR